MIYIVTQTIHRCMYVHRYLHPKRCVRMSRTLHHVTTVDVVVYLSTGDHSSAKSIIVYVDGMFSDGL